jgi:hypothetical protein
VCDLRKCNLESLLNRLQYLLIRLAADERDRKTLCSETTGTTDTVEVGVGIGGEIVVDGQVDALDIDTTAEDVGSDTDTLVELFEFLVAFDTIPRSERLIVRQVIRHTVLPDQHQSGQQ